MRRFARCGQWGREAPWLTERGSWRERRTQRPSSFPPPGSGQSGARQLVFWKLETVEIRPIMFCLRRSDAFDCKNIVTCTPWTSPPAFAVVNGRHPLGRNWLHSSASEWVETGCVGRRGSRVRRNAVGPSGLNYFRGRRAFKTWGGRSFSPRREKATDARERCSLSEISRAARSETGEMNRFRKLTRRRRASSRDFGLSVLLCFVPSLFPVSGVWSLIGDRRKMLVARRVAPDTIDEQTFRRRACPPRHA